MTRTTTLFFDVGGVILTNGWDCPARCQAAEHFGLDWDEFEERHELMVSDFEIGRKVLKEYLDRTTFYQPRPFTQNEFNFFHLGAIAATSLVAGIRGGTGSLEKVSAGYSQ
jgi:putative hydrolase of the HAD superfamily